MYPDVNRFPTMPFLGTPKSNTEDCDTFPPLATLAKGLALFEGPSYLRLTESGPLVFQKWQYFVTFLKKGLGDSCWDTCDHRASKKCI